MAEAGAILMLRRETGGALGTDKNYWAINFRFVNLKISF